MLKVGVKRTRTKEQIEADKNEHELKEKAILDKVAELSKKEQEMRNNAAAADILSDLIKSGAAV